VSRDEVFDLVFDEPLGYILGPLVVLSPGIVLTLIAGFREGWDPIGGAPADAYMPYVTIFLWANALVSPVIGSMVDDFWEGMMAFGIAMFPVGIVLWVLAMVLGYGAVATLGAIGVIILLVAMFCALFM
jgi:hypothetical protein